MKHLLIALLFLPAASHSHDDVFSIAYNFDGGVRLSYHNLHFEPQSIGYYGAFLYEGTKDKKLNTYIDTVTQDVTTTVTETVSIGRATKCNPAGKCFEFGPERFETITTEVTEQVFVDVERKEIVKDEFDTYQLTFGASYAFSHDVYPYAGIDAALVDDDVEWGANIGVLINLDKFGFDVGYHTITEDFYAGVRFEF